MKRTLLYFIFIICGTNTLSAQTYELNLIFSAGSGFDDEVSTSGIDSNGKLLMGGDFANYNGTARTYLARLNADGTLDTGYDPSASLSSSIYDLAVHADNSVTVVTGGFLKRFDDTGVQFSGGSFTPDATNNVINVVAAESTGFAVVIGGVFTNVGNRIARLNENGTIDATFATNIGSGFNGIVRAIEITDTGKILVGGDFTSFNGVTRNKVAVLNSNGTLDVTFDPGTVLATNVFSLDIQDDGKILAGSNLVVRFMPDGTKDTAFSGNIDLLPVNDIYANGTDDIIIGVAWSTGVMALDYTDGSVIDIAAGNGAEDDLSPDVKTIAVLGDGSIVLGGSFNSYNGMPVANIARIAICDVSFSTQPVDILTCESSDASLTVVASGTGTLSYEWWLNTNGGTGLYDVQISDDATYSGSNSATLDISDVISGMDGYYYRCIVTDDNCYSTSNAVSLTVSSQSITADPVNNSVCVGGNANFSITHTGSSEGFQWQEDPDTGVFADIVNGDMYSGATTSSFTVIGATANMNGYKYHLVSSFCPPIASVTLSATLTVNEKPLIVEQAEDYSVCVSSDVVFSVDATATGAITYQWQYNNAGIFADLSDNATYSGVDTETLAITEADISLPEIITAGQAQYRCMVSANGCLVVGNTVNLYINETPVVSTHPLDYTECIGAGSSSRFFGFTLSNGSGQHNLLYQWEIDDGTGFIDVTDDAIFTGAQSSSLNITGATSSLSGLLLRCKIGNCTVPVYTDAATLTLDDLPEITGNSEKIVNVCRGSDAEYSITATGSNNTYQWQYFAGSGYTDLPEDSHYSGTSSNTLQIDGDENVGSYTSYKCVVTNGTCEVNSTSFTLNERNIPTFSGPPADRVACDGGTAVGFSKSASNFNAVVNSYQWQEAFAESDIFVDISDGDVFGGVETSNLAILSPTFSMDGNRYRLTVKGCVSDIATDPATLTVHQLPVILASPDLEEVCTGDVATFSVTATGSDNITYLWYVSTDGGATYATSSALGSFTGQNTSTLTISNLSADMNGYMLKCIVSNPSPCLEMTAESLEAVLTVYESTSITAQPEILVKICNGGDASFAVVAQGEGLSYQWVDASNSNTPIADGGIYSGSTTATLSITGITTEQSNGYFTLNNYRCIITGTCGEETSGVSQLQVNGGGKAEIQASLSNPATPILIASGGPSNGSITYEWFRDGTAFTNGSNNISIDQEGSYTVVISGDGCPSEASDPYVHVLVTGLEDEHFKTVSIYPNPTFDVLQVDLQGMQEVNMRLLSLDGKLAKDFGLQGGENIELSVSGLQSGIYFLQLLSKNKNTLQRVLIK